VLTLVTGLLTATAGVGLIALLRAVERRVIAAVVLTCEISSGYEFILPLAFACGAATLTSRSLERGSLYRLGPRRRPPSPEPPRPRFPLHSTRKVPTLACAPDLLPELLTRDPRPLFVVDERGRLEGALHPEPARQRIAAESLPRLLVAGDLTDREFPQLSVRAPHEEPRALFGGREAPRFVPDRRRRGGPPRRSLPRRLRALRPSRRPLRALEAS
jgi:hypothetical protein